MSNYCDESFYQQNIYTNTYSLWENSAYYDINNLSPQNFSSSWHRGNDEDFETRYTSGPTEAQPSEPPDQRNRRVVDRTSLYEDPDSFYRDITSVNSAIGNKTPFEKWVLRKPCDNHLHPFGSKAFVLIKGLRNNKFAPKAYSSTSKAYRVYVPSKRKSLISRDVRVVKGNYYSNPNDNVNNFLYNENKHCDSATEMKKTQVDIDDADDSHQNDITENVVNADATQNCENDQEADTDSEQYHKIPDHEDL
ncbi:unnamed protein product [Arctia plantaginis]|uniref:Retroviral polymerase SH3-like domain-containing protein n=1 Tax=Arctia plantaginis TaxID=874455 RepID=A0A8S1A941_ARCPL|nr:unnamed protein product [Arctia plantaginis]